ncbi:MAG: ATP-binding protein [Gemmataceae bacterium]|nr:ATP-binding protein [Gemmataceae bacterium]
MLSQIVTRLTAPVIAVSLLLLAVGTGAAWYVHQLQAANDRILEQHLASVWATQELEVGLREVRSRLNRFVYHRNEEALKGIPELRANTEAALATMERTALTERELDWVRRIRSGLDEFYREVEHLSTSPADMRPHGQIDHLLYDVILPLASDYREVNEHLFEQATRSNQQSSRRLIRGLLLLGIGGAAGGILVGWFLARTIQRSIVRVHVRLRDAAGKLREAVDSVRVDRGKEPEDLGVLAERLIGPINELLERLQRSRQEVLHAEQLANAGQMAAGVAHEVRNPLTAIKLLVQSALDRGPDAALSGRDLQVLDEEVARLERLTSTFLDFARPPRPEKRLIDVAEVLQRVLELVGPRADLHGVNLRWQAQSPLPPIEGDPGQLHQVLYNLIINALEVAPVGSDVWVRIVGRSGDHPSVTIQVEDSGSGIPKELGDRIFEPFVSTKETGMGLGLSICRRVVESHGGTIHAENRPQGGARFVVTLPSASPARVAAVRNEAQPCPG